MTYSADTYSNLECDLGNLNKILAAMLYRPERHLVPTGIIHSVAPVAADSCPALS